MSAIHHDTLQRSKQVEVCIEIGEDKCLQYYNIGTQIGNDYKSGTIDLVFDGDTSNETVITIGVWESLEQNHTQRVIVIHGDWTIEGKLNKIEHISTIETCYCCENSLFPFTISVKELPE